MSWADATNAAFALSACVPLGMSVRRVWKDRDVKGISPWQYGFFATWGLWNTFYYPYLEQWISFLAELLVCLLNLCWLASAWWVLREKKLGNSNH